MKLVNQLYTYWSQREPRKFSGRGKGSQTFSFWFFVGAVGVVFFGRNLFFAFFVVVLLFLVGGRGGGI